MSEVSTNRAGDRRGMPEESRANLQKGGVHHMKHGMTSQGAREAREVLETALESIENGDGLTVVGQAALLNSIVRGEGYARRAFEHLNTLEGDELLSAGAVRVSAEARCWARLGLDVQVALGKAHLAEEATRFQDRVLKVQQELARMERE